MTKKKWLKISDEQLTEVVATSISISQVLRALGVSEGGGSHSHYSKRIRRAGIDTRHFIGRGARKDLLSPEEIDRIRAHGTSRRLVSLSHSDLELLVKRSLSYRDVARFIKGTNQISGSFLRTLRKLILDSEISIDHFTGRAHNRGKESPYRRTPEEVLVKSLHKENGPALIRSLINIGRPRECEGLETKCPVSLEWNGKPIKLHVDHIDGDTYNNVKENLRFLCPNCHSQTPTYCRQLKFRVKP